MPYPRWLSLAAVATCLVGCGVRHVEAASAQDLPGGLRSGGIDRTYTLHVPPGEPVGLVLSLHGGGGTGIGQRGLTDFDPVADAHHLLVVYPDGFEKSWADGRGAAPADRHHVDDVAFLVSLVGKLRGDYNIDPGHVFVTGMSNGGFMSTRLACDRADVFAAIAPVAGTLGANVACNPSRPVSVWAAHGTADPLVPFNGGVVRGRGGVSHAVSVKNMLSKWRAVDGCQGDPSAQVLPDAGDGTVVHRFDSGECAAASEVVLYQVDKGGHTWPGGKQYLPRTVIGPTTRALNASEAIAQFFLAHGRE
ncbi:extracellular catalytic domain type 1 short-chain-length polyhydroxyalkanoate depolymerase [Mycobacterium parmense]|uniref:Hydrolase n=1 Tax=Mycobacterium parmense TaxID=185642 RepID=A0A7I7YUR2_9MYCO|nr:PHB depolymerase family esterase [Mycobacterium parmense]MCV7350957.1 esterase [Mycobacterium parmense]ORW53529.1 esterase [Mycobacterium parmense]BBZ45605.1 hydrolase [Mycobacterium parmense]